MKPKGVFEKIPERSFIVYKTCIDPAVIKLAVEKMKKELFVRKGFFRRVRALPEDIQCVSIDKYYEPYIFLDGKYSIDYFLKRYLTLQVDEDAKEVVILGKKIEPKIMNDPEEGAYGVTTIEAEIRLSHEEEAKLILDKVGREVPFEQIPLAPSEEDPQKILDEFNERAGKLQVAPDEEIEILRARIVQRPTDMDRVDTELFEVCERAVIYTPIYEITFQNAKTGKKKIVRMDGVTAKILEDRRKEKEGKEGRTLWPPFSISNKFEKGQNNILQEIE
jgi:hypothetical protein